MKFGAVFKNLGKFVFLVKEEAGDLDLETGLRPKYYEYERVLALIGSRNYGLQLHMTIDESMVVLPKQAKFIIIGDQVFKLNLKSSAFGVFIYEKDKVDSHEFRLILDGVPKAGSA